MDYKDEFELLVQAKQYEEARILLEKHHIYALEDPFYYANMGWILNQLERYEEALICLNKGNTLFPKDGWIFSQIAFSYNRLDFIEDGLAAIEEAMILGFDEPWLHAEKGWALKELKEYEQAVKSFEDALLEEPDNIWFLSQAAYTYLELKNDVIAEEYFLKAYRLQPNDDSIYDLIHFYKNKQDYASICRYLLEHTSDEYEAWRYFELGSAFHEQAKDQEALTYLLKALHEGKDDTGLQTLLGDVYLALEDIELSLIHYNLALSYYEKALLRDHLTDREWIWQEMVWIAHKQKDQKKKLSYLKRAYKEYPKNTWLLYHFARCYSDRLEYDQGANACFEYIRLEGETKDILDLYAWNLGRSHHEAKAIDILIRRNETYGSDTWSYGEMGWNYAHQKDYKQAILQFHKALELHRDHYMHVSMLGWCYLQLKDYQQALIYLHEAEHINQDDGWLYSAIGEAYIGIDDNKQAINYLTKALELGYDEKWLHERITDLRNPKLQKV